MTERGDWVGYYEGQGERAPHDLILQALALFEAEGRSGQAVDLGCGQGFETAELLRRGWEVVAIDATEEAIRRLRRRIPDSHAPRLRTVVSRMEDVDVPAADLVHASFSLPFCPPESFPRLWSAIREAIRPRGRFAGELFGDRDTWASIEEGMTFFDIASARALFDGMELESFVEEENDGEGWDEMKHWHVFHAIARR
ncbi:MAG TPA: class I SAM-dependent methyltransferase [Actinomycetota bacterium]